MVDALKDAIMRYRPLPKSREVLRWQLSRDTIYEEQVAEGVSMTDQFPP
jgi:hypothetical protein